MHNDDEVLGSHGGECENECSEMLRFVMLFNFTEISEKVDASLIRVP
jgi:hypothetical protein